MTLFGMRRLLLVLSLLLPGTAVAAEANIVSRDVTVIDGDSIVIAGRRLELLGIDAPELAQLCYLRAEPWPCGKEARDALAGFLVGKEVDCHEILIDGEGRSVGRCSIVGLDAGAELVTRGFAVLDPAYRGYYLRNFREARYNSAGIMGGRFVVPWEWRAGKRLDPEQLKRDISASGEPAPAAVD
jgi:endonuclease YncB( thermonuclease family)